ncbi:MAG: PorV/PorQ family protein [Bacteroidales bacterium]
MKHIIKTILSIAVFSTISIFNVDAQTGVKFLNLPTNANALSKGDATVGSNANSFSYFSNSSSVAFSENTFSAGFSYGQWQPDYTDNIIMSFGAYYKLSDRFSLTAGYENFSYNADIFTYNEEGRQSDALSPKESAYGIGIVYRASQNFSFGVNAKNISSDLSSEDASAFAVDLSASYKLDNIQLGIAATNLGGKIKYANTEYDLPSAVKVGGMYTYKLGENTLAANLEGDYWLNDSSMSFGIGGEFAFKDCIFLRAGYHLGDEDKTIPSYGSVGIGAKYNWINIDFAYILAGSDSPLKNGLNISLEISF